MAKKDRTQKTRRGPTQPVPKRKDFMRDSKRAARPVTHRPKK